MCLCAEEVTLGRWMVWGAVGVGVGLMLGTRTAPNLGRPELTAPSPWGRGRETLSSYRRGRKQPPAVNDPAQPPRPAPPTITQGTFPGLLPALCKVLEENQEVKLRENRKLDGPAGFPDHHGAACFTSPHHWSPPRPGISPPLKDFSPMNLGPTGSF